MFIASVGIAMVGCKKSVLQPNDQNELSTSKFKGVSVSNNMLKFETLDDYYAIVNDLSVAIRDKFSEHAKKLDFKNYFSKAQINQSDSSQEMDDFFGQIINQDGCIQIGKHIYKIDLTKERVFVVDANKMADNYQDLIVGKISNKEISQYALTDDVLTLANGGITEKCSSPGGFELSSPSVEPGTSLEFRCYFKLFSAGIYYRVTGRTKKIGNYGGNYRFKLYVVLNTANIHRRPCANDDVTTHWVGLKSNTYNVSEPVWEAYSKAWNVKNMYLYFRSDAEFIGDISTVYRSTQNVGVNF